MNAVANWLATYWIHSTLALGAAWLIDRSLPHRLRIVEAVWKFALVAGLVTATLQLGLGIRPLGGRRPLPFAAPARAATATQASVVETPLAPRPVSVGVPKRSHAVHRAAALAPAPRREVPLGPTLFVGAWLLGGAIALGVLLVSWRRFQRRLSDRRELADGRIRSALAALRQVAGRRGAIRLTRSSSVDVPLAMGVVRHEICVPERALTELDGERIDALLAHELAHLQRRDPAWLLLSSFLSRAFFLQPLHWVAARRLAACAELACDDLAAEWTCRPLALAHCLADVAGWMVEPQLTLRAPAMAGAPSLLRQRVERLLAAPRRRELLPMWFPTAAVAVVSLALLGAPSCASWEEGTPPPTHMTAAPRVAAAPPPAVVPAGDPQLLMGPIPVVVAEHHRHRVRHLPVVVRVQHRDDDDDDNDADDDDNGGGCAVCARDEDDDDDQDVVADALEELPEQIAEALEAVEEARTAMSAETLQEIENQVRQAIEEARRNRPSSAELARAQQQVQRALEQTHRAMEQARRSLPPRAELERAQEEVRRAMEETRRNLQERLGDRERLQQEMRRVAEEMQRSQREMLRLQNEMRRLRE